VGACWGTLWELVESLLGILLERYVNTVRIMGTHWDQQKSNTPTLPQKGKNLGPLGAFFYAYTCSLPFGKYG
jgi:hypothetical protein